MGIFTVQEYLQFFLADAVSLPEGMKPDTALSLCMAPLLACALVSPLVAGVVSDRLGGARKVIVAAAGSIMIFCCVALAFVRSWPAVPAIAGIFGLGYGAFNRYTAHQTPRLACTPMNGRCASFGLLLLALMLDGALPHTSTTPPRNSLDFALALDVLPSQEHAAQDLGAWNLALYIPLAIAAPIAGLILDSVNAASHNMGYATLFALAGAYLFLGVVFIYRVKKVR
jgi:MFS family permease